MNVESVVRTPRARSRSVPVRIARALHVYAEVTDVLGEEGPSLVPGHTLYTGREGDLPRWIFDDSAREFQGHELAS